MSDRHPKNPPTSPFWFIKKIGGGGGGVGMSCLVSYHHLPSVNANKTILPLDNDFKLNFIDGDLFAHIYIDVSYQFLTRCTVYGLRINIYMYMYRISEYILASLRNLSQFLWGHLIIHQVNGFKTHYKLGVVFAAVTNSAPLFRNRHHYLLLKCVSIIQTYKTSLHKQPLIAKDKKQKHFSG